MDWTLTIQVTIAVVAGLAVVALAAAVILLGRNNRHLSADIKRLTETAVQQADAVRALAEETYQDRAIAAQPLLVLLDEPPIGIRDQPWAAVRVRNVGSGPALHFVVWMLASGGLYRSAGPEVQGFSGALHLASGDIFEPGPLQNMLYVGKRHGYLDPGTAVVGDDPSANLAAYCGDQFGNRYRFNLRTADPAQIWERGADAPSWAGAWDPRLSSEALSRGETPTVVTSSSPQRDAAQLIEALADALYALQTGGAERDVHITGQAGTAAQTQ